MAIPMGILAQGGGLKSYWLARTDTGGYVTNWSADLYLSDNIVTVSNDDSPKQMAVRRIDETGTLIAQYSLTRANYVDPAGMAISANGSTYILNFYSGGTYLVWEIIKTPPPTNLGSFTGIDWQKRFEGSTLKYDINQFGSIDTDSGNDVYVTSGIYVYATTPYRANLLLKYNSAGTFQFAKTFRASGFDVECDAIGANDAVSGVAVAGTVQKSGLVIRYTSAGVVSWQKILTSTVSAITLGADQNACAMDASGNVYVLYTGYDLGTNTRENVLIKYLSNGNPSWQRKSTTAIGGDQSVKVGADGFIYVTTNDGRVFKFDSSGNLIWKRIITGMTYNNSAGAFVTDKNTFFFPGQVGILYAPTDGTTGPITGYTYTEETATTWTTGDGLVSSVASPTVADFAGTTTNTDFAAGTITDTITKIDW